MTEVADYRGTPSGEAEPETVAVAPGHAELAEVVDGEVVDEPSLVPSVVLRPVQVIRIVVQPEHAKTAGRHLAYIPIGASVVAKRLWDSRSTSRYERFIRAAEATGNHEAALEWKPGCRRSARIAISGAST
jgi:S-DNA-T family DNA segregation ATPase FtsK/SpoIIIE